MTLRLTPKQYKTLVKMAWISSRVVQGSEQQDSETVEQILEMTDHLCTVAPDFGAEDFFESVEAEEEEPSFSVGAPPPLTVRLQADVEDELMALIEWFEEFSFWDILEDRLAMRDISEERTEAQWNWLPDAEKDRIYDKYLNFYFEEFSEHGISSLRLVQPEPGKPVVPLGWGEGAGPAAPAGHGPSESGRRPGKIIEFPGGGPGGTRGPDGKPPKKPKG
jgi:hypothetical protein